MHSRIFQISSKPIDEKNYINEDRYYSHDTGFVGSVADYAVANNEPSDYEWLNSQPGISVDLRNKTFKLVSKEDYFRASYMKFKEYLAEAEQMTFEDFICGRSIETFVALTNSFENIYAIYVDDIDECNGLITLDDLVRNSEDGTVWHLGATINYHF